MEAQYILKLTWGVDLEGLSLSLAMARSTEGHWSREVSTSVFSQALHGKNACKQLAETAWKKEMQCCSSYMGSSASAGTQNKMRGALRQQHCAGSQAAMMLTLLWVKGHKPEKKCVYHVGNSCHP